MCDSEYRSHIGEELADTFFSYFDFVRNLILILEIFWLIRLLRMIKNIR